MAKTMTAPEGLTDGQIEALANQVRDAARKHRNELCKDQAQQALGVENLGMRMFAIFRKLTEKMGGIIARLIKVDRSQSPKQVIQATGRVGWYIDETVLTEMPREGRAEDQTLFFELDYGPTVDELDREYEARDMRPDPYAVSQAMIDDPTFADERPVAVQWRNKHGRACCAIFYRGGD